MDINHLLPIGSVVRLNEGKKKLVIIGIKQTSVENNNEYDYMGVLYPEGFLGGACQYLFNHSDINDIYFKGFEDEERLEFLKRLNNFYAQAK